MMNLQDPLALAWLALPVLLVAFFLLRRRKKGGRVLRMGSLAPAIADEIRRSRWMHRGLFTLGILTMVLMAFVIARPSRVVSWTKKFSEGIDIVIVLDVSESMEATDLTPTRFIAAKNVIKDFISKRSEDRIGFVIFGGESVTKSPLTRDYDFLNSQVDGLELRELKQGTAIGMGLANGIGRLRNSESKTKVILLLTDGDSNVGSINPITASQLARQDGIKIYSVGIGKENRVLVPIYAFDMQGKKTQMIAQVPSYINPELLKEISRMTGGKSFMARDTGMLNRILAEIDRLEKTRVQMQPMQRREELFFWPALIATALLFSLFLLQETRFRRAHAVKLFHWKPREKRKELAHAAAAR